MIANVFTNENFHTICNLLAAKDRALQTIIDLYGLPPMWTRPAIFQTLVLTILEQQVSLASAYTAFNKLTEKIDFITPEKLLQLTDEELRACYLSRQKIVYVRALAIAVIDETNNLVQLSTLADAERRTTLKQVKGSGDWTVDVYLIHALQRTDVFPVGDVALVNSLKVVKQLPPHISKEEMLMIAEDWRPFRTVASMMLWHAYIQRKKIKVFE